LTTLTLRKTSSRVVYISAISSMARRFARFSIFPSQRTITSGEYPLSRQLLITTTTRSLARGEVRDFMTHYLKSAQTLAEQQRLVVLPDETVRAQQAWLTGEQAPLLYAPDDDATAPATPVQSEKPAR